MRARLVVTLATMAGAVLVALGLALPIGAQSPIDGAVATLAVATAQAQQWQQAQQATRQAQSVELTRQAQAALATRQANEAQATRQALDGMATRQVIEATATAGAVFATATQQAQDAQARATSAAIDAQATKQAYTQAEAERNRQERSAQATEVFLYSAFALGLAGLAFVFGRVVMTLRAIERKASKAATGPADLPPAQSSDDAQAIDGEFTERNTRGLDFEVITDPVSIQMFEDYVLEHGK